MTGTRGPRDSWIDPRTSGTTPRDQGLWDQMCKGVVVRERSGTSFRQIFWSRNGAPANIVGHRCYANTEAFRQITSYSLGWPSISLFSGPNCRQTRDLASKISKEISGGDTPGHPQQEGGDPLPHLPPARLHAMRGGASSPVAGT